MSELFENKKAKLKELIKALHAGANPDEVKKIQRSVGGYRVAGDS